MGCSSSSLDVRCYVGLCDGTSKSECVQCYHSACEAHWPRDRDTIACDICRVRDPKGCPNCGSAATTRQDTSKVVGVVGVVAVGDVHVVNSERVHIRMRATDPDVTHQRQKGFNVPEDPDTRPVPADLVPCMVCDRCSIRNRYDGCQHIREESDGLNRSRVHRCHYCGKHWCMVCGLKREGAGCKSCDREWAQCCHDCWKLPRTTCTESKRSEIPTTATTDATTDATTATEKVLLERPETCRGCECVIDRGNDAGRCVRCAGTFCTRCLFQGPNTRGNDILSLIPSTLHCMDCFRIVCPQIANKCRGCQQSLQYPHPEYTAECDRWYDKHPLPYHSWNETPDCDGCGDGPCKSRQHCLPDRSVRCQTCDDPVRWLCCLHRKTKHRPSLKPFECAQCGSLQCARHLTSCDDCDRTSLCPCCLTSTFPAALTTKIARRRCLVCQLARSQVLAALFVSADAQDIEPGRLCTLAATATTATATTATATTATATTATATTATATTATATATATATTITGTSKNNAAVTRAPRMWPVARISALLFAYDQAH